MGKMKIVAKSKYLFVLGSVHLLLMGCGNGIVETETSSENFLLNEGLPSATPTRNPSEVPASGNAIAAGALHTCSIIAGGQVKCWGDNEFGQLGNGNQSDSATPVLVNGLSSVTSIGSSDFHNCAILTSGQVKCWGHNLLGQLGNGSQIESSTPVFVSGLTGAISVGVGSSSSCALISGGQVKCWGSNSFGQLGNGTFNNSSTPVLVSGLVGATAIAVNIFHACAVIAGGQVKCWGRNSEGQLGNGILNGNQAVPVLVNNLTGVIAVAAGQLYSCALTASGQVKCWGDNLYGQLGNGNTNRSLIPVLVSGLTGVTSFHSNATSNCAIIANGQVKCWGNSQFGKLGNGTGTSSNAPTTNPVLVGNGLTGVTSVRVGSFHACAGVSGGGAKCWGLNSDRQLGNGAIGGFYTLPIDVLGL